MRLLTIVLIAIAAYSGAALAQEGHPAAGYSSVMTVESLTAEGPAAARVVLGSNEVAAEAGLPTISAQIDDGCFLGFVKVDPSGSYKEYHLSNDFDRTADVTYQLTGSGICAYDPMSRVDACKSGTYRYFIKYPDQSNFLDQVIYDTERELQADENGRAEKHVSCDAVAEQLEAHIEPSGVLVESGPISPMAIQYAPLVRSAATDKSLTLKVMEKYKK